MRTATHRLVTSEGGDIVQRYRFLFPGMSVTAHADGDTQTRTLHGYRGICQQGGDEILARFGFDGAARRIADEALELVAAPNCPSGTMDVLLMPDQMILQIHESIGHPLELDRILGDERNFAGHELRHARHVRHLPLRLGPPQRHVRSRRAARSSRATAGTTTGTPAQKVHLIRNGILERPLGGAISQARAGLPGTSNARADGWNRPPIDRMANLNIEPGDASLDEMIAGIERGVLMETNCSWSIDDSRNKFQFGCERGRLIENGKLGAVVKNPNYRGISANFWRSLARVGNADTLQVLGTPHCGKGEPSQVIRVGPCVAGVRVHGRRRVRGRSMMAPREQAEPASGDGRRTSTSSPQRSTASSRPARPTPRAFSAEASDFVRMNRGKVRQPGSVDPALPRRRPDPRARGTRRTRSRSPATSPPTARDSAAAVAATARRAARSRRRSAPADRDRRAVDARSARRTAAAGGGDHRRGARRRARRPTSSASTRADRSTAASRTRSASATGTRRRRSTCSGASTTAPTRR